MKLSRRICALLEEDKQAEEEDPEDAHGVPVPGGAVDEDLPQLQAMEQEERGERGGEREDAEDKVSAMRPGDEVEEVAAGIGGEEEALGGEVIPGHPLADEEGDAERDGGGEPGRGAARGGPAHAEPLFHHIEFVEELAARHLHGDAGEDEDGGVEIEDGRNQQRMPIHDVGAVAVEVAGGLAEEEGGDQRHEEHEVAGQSGEDAHAITHEQRAWAAAVAMVPVFVATATAGGPTVDRRPTAKPRIFSFAIDIDNRPRSEGGGHGSFRWHQLTPVGMPSPTVE